MLWQVIHGQALQQGLPEQQQVITCGKLSHPQANLHDKVVDITIWEVEPTRFML